MARLPDPGPLPRPFGPYQLIRRIAVGGMAEVYVALARGVSGFEKLVALKLIHPGFSEDDHFVDMLIDEAKLSVLLTHANIAQTFDLGSVDGRYYIVMEYVDGADASRLLDKVLAKSRQLPIESALFIMQSVGQALDFAHRKTDPFGDSLRVIHRDVSPQNVLLGRDGDVKLTDFGIAKAALRTSETEVGVIKGKYCYMSPEQAWADPIDHRSDIFSAGVVLFELLTGRMLFSPDENLPALLEKVRKAEVPPPSTFRGDIPKTVDDIVLRALARNPDERFESAGDFAFELERELWRMDHTWGTSRMSRLMSEYFPADTEDPSAASHRTGRTAVTRMEGTHAKMQSLEFIPEVSTSALFGDSGDDRISNRPSAPARRSNRPSTLKDIVEGRATSSDPRVESSYTSPPSGDEDEATTFFSKSAFAAEAAAPAARSQSQSQSQSEDDEATIIDGSGDLARKLEAMVSLGGARVPQSETIITRDLDEVPQTKRQTFRPPKPQWSPIPFVGPPLEPADGAATEARGRAGGVFVPLPIAIAAGLGFVILAIAVIYALQ